MIRSAGACNSGREVATQSSNTTVLNPLESALNTVQSTQMFVSTPGDIKGVDLMKSQKAPELCLEKCIEGVLLDNFGAPIRSQSLDRVDQL